MEESFSIMVGIKSETFYKNLLNKFEVLLLLCEYICICLRITNNCINSYQFIISLSCSYMFRQLCAILRELVCTY
jgi:hypothetical protein